MGQYRRRSFSAGHGVKPKSHFPTKRRDDVLDDNCVMITHSDEKSSSSYFVDFHGGNTRSQEIYVGGMPGPQGPSGIPWPAPRKISSKSDPMGSTKPVRLPSNFNYKPPMHYTPLDW